MLAVDTNILVYAEGFGAEAKQNYASSLLRAAQGKDLVVPVQVLGELFRVLVNKAKLSRKDAQIRVSRYQATSSVAPTLLQTFAGALDLAAQHRLQIFDAIILAASAEAGCRMLLSEDMQDGFVWRGTMVVNPFAPTPHPLITDLLRR